jgi:DNA-binding response OmpR family regulator
MNARKTTILFADDEPAIRMTLPVILEHEGFEVTTAATVAEALRCINTKPFDVLLADLNIGEKGDGFTLISAMRRVQPAAVTLILTGFPDFESALEAIRSQVDDYLTKPTNIKHLVETIQERSKRPRRSPPLQIKRVSTVLRENIDPIIDGWLKETSASPVLSSLELDNKARIDHLRQMIEEIAKRIEKDGNLVGPESSPAGIKHGEQRYEQGYGPRQIATEGRLLHMVISRVIESHLLSIDMSTCVSDVMVVGEALHEQFEESLRAFEDHAGFRKTG